MKHTNKKGFTIIELVIVIAIIAILAAILIPTFASLIKKANLSVDMQVVKQMNTVLQTNEAVSGKPATVVDAKEILAANGCDDFTPADSDNVYYWVGSENRVILWEKSEDDATKGKVTFPNDLAKKYKGITTVSAAWSDLSIEITDENYVKVEVEEGETPRVALLNAIQEAADGTIIKLPENTTWDLGAGGLSFLGSYMTNDGGTGKTLTIDLNGGTINSLTPHSNGYYYGGKVPVGGSLTLVNGDVNVAGYVNGFNVEAGAHLVMRDVELNVPDGDAIFPAGNAAEVVLENCKITAGANYAVATNNQMSDNIYIKITNTTLEAPSCALLVNVPADVLIDGSTIIGGGWGLLLRSGHAVVSNTTIKTTDGDVGTNDSRYNTSCEYFAYNASDANIPYWGQGAQVPYAPVIVGDYSNHDAYNHDTNLTMTNVKFENANSAAIPDIVVAARPSGKDVVVEYDDATVVGKLVVFGEGYVRNKFVGLDGKTLYGINHTFTHNGTITVNGATKTYTGTVESPIITETFGNRYAIPEAVGTFEAYKTYDISVLNVEVDGVNILDEFKAHYTAQGLVLTEAQWATVQFAAGSTPNSIKTIIYDSSAE